MDHGQDQRREDLCGPSQRRQCKPAFFPKAPTLDCILTIPLICPRGIVPLVPPQLVVPRDRFFGSDLPAVGRPKRSLRPRLYRPPRRRPGRQSLSRREVPRLGRRRRSDPPLVARDRSTGQDLLGSPRGRDDSEPELVVREHGTRFGRVGRDGAGLGCRHAAELVGSRRKRAGRQRSWLLVVDGDRGRHERRCRGRGKGRSCRWWWRRRCAGRRRRSGLAPDLDRFAETGSGGQGQRRQGRGRLSGR